MSTGTKTVGAVSVELPAIAALMRCAAKYPDSTFAASVTDSALTKLDGIAETLGRVAQVDSRQGAPNDAA